MDDLLDPKIDFVFKRIFGSEENKDVLCAFLNEALKTTEPEPITDLTIVNPFLDKNMLNDKQSVLDIRAVTEDGKQVNIEIQLANPYDMNKRTLYYWAKLYTEQLQEGQRYHELKKTITINILDFKFLNNDQYHSIFHLRDNTSRIVLTDDIEIHIMELQKLQEGGHSLQDGLVKWLLFLKGVDKSNWEKLARGEPELEKAMTTLDFLSQDKEARLMYDMRKKALLDQRSAIASAKEEERKEIAKKLLLKGTPITFIVEVTGLTEEEVTALQKSLKDRT